MIVDITKVYFQSGRGGEGSSSLMRISSRKAFACGGDGGRGGDVILKVSPHLYDLSKFKGNKKFIAKNGQQGKEKNKYGKNAEDLIVKVPRGTRVIENQKVLVDLADREKSFLICRGGRGGKGNNKRSYCLPPQEGEAKEIVLDYRIPNEVAILGFANSGKTSIFNSLTGQKAKVASYPFTTTSCFWSEIEHEFKKFTVLDTPSIKEAKPGLKYTENAFLRHIFRSRLIILISDNCLGFKNDFLRLKNEISLFDSGLLKEKIFFYLLAKVDKIDKENIQKKNSLQNPQEAYAVSVKEFQGIDKLKKLIFDNLG